MNWKDWKNHTKRRPCPQLQTTNPNSQWYVSWKRIIPFVGVCWTDRGWEILVDGKSCPGGQMLQDYYSPGWNNPHSTMGRTAGIWKTFASTICWCPALVAKLNGETFPTVLEAWEALLETGQGYSDGFFCDDEARSRHKYIGYLPETK